MRDWNKLIADENYWMGKHYTPGRSQRLRGIVLHHNAANLSLRGCYDVWQTREASAHYQVDANGRIGQYVRDNDTAWASLSANPWTIAIEHANNTLAPSWTISDATLEAGAHLVAALCHVYGLGVPTWGVNVFPHSRFGSTACPGAIAGAQREAYMARARYWFEQMTNGNQDEREETEMLLLVDGKWWYQTQGAYARGVSSPEMLTKLDKVMKTIKITGAELRSNWVVIENSDWAADLAAVPLRVKSNNQLLTGYEKMPEWMKRSSLLGRLTRKLGA